MTVVEPTLIQSLILVAVGGAVGAVLRFGMGHVVDSSQFPWATFAVNLIGSFGLALLMFGWPDISPEWRVLLFTGLFGAFTTMSTFTVDTVTMLYDGRTGEALMNFVLNPCLCIGGALAGRYAAMLF